MERLIFDKRSEEDSKENFYDSDSDKSETVPKNRFAYGTDAATEECLVRIAAASDKASERVVEFGFFLNGEDDIVAQKKLKLEKREDLFASAMKILLGTCAKEALTNDDPRISVNDTQQLGELPLKKHFEALKSRRIKCKLADKAAYSSQVCVSTICSFDLTCKYVPAVITNSVGK